MLPSTSRLSPLLRVSLLLAAVACGGESEGGAEAGLECSVFSACGGDPIGTWRSQALCLPDDFADQLLAGLPPECAGSVVLEDATSSSTLSFGADGLFTETGAATLEWAMRFEQTCFSAAAEASADELIIGLFCDALGQELASNAMDSMLSDLSCAVVGDACECGGRQETPINASGRFAIEGSQVVYLDTDLRQDFCVQDGQLQVGAVEGAGLDAHVVYTRAP